MANCKINRPEPQELFNRIRDTFSANVLGGAEVIPESNEWYVVANDYAMAEEFYAISEQQWRERDPRYACCENLIKIAADDGVFLRSAQPAKGYVRIEGTPGAVLDPSFELKFGDQYYRLDANAATPATMPDSGFTIVRVKAVDPGPEANNPTTTTGQFVTPQIDISENVEIYGNGFCGGVENEECEDFRSRYLDRKRYSPRPGMSWLKDKLLEWPCVTRVCERGGVCCKEECECGSQRFELYAFFDDTFDYGLAPECVLADINHWLLGNPQGYGLGEAPFNMCGQVYTAYPSIVDIHIAGLECITVDQEREIINQINEYFGQLCPSQEICNTSIDVLIAQVLGDACDHEFQFKPHDDNLTVTDCCTLTPECDILPVLGCIKFVGRQEFAPDCNDPVECEEEEPDCYDG